MWQGARQGTGKAPFMTGEREFFNLYKHGFIRVAAGIPAVKIADPDFNLRRVAELVVEAEREKAVLVVFPELTLSAYTCGDLFFQDALLDRCESALLELACWSCKWPMMVIVGVPLRWRGGIYNCAAAIYKGKILGVVPKTYLPNYREFYEKRHFESGHKIVKEMISLGKDLVPFGTRLLFESTQIAGFSVAIELCEDLWSPIPPSTYSALAGALVLVNLSASNITVAKDDYRRTLCAAQSGKCIAAYVYTAAGMGESTTDMAWDGHAMIWENGELLAESKRFSLNEQLIVGDVDLDKLRADRLRVTSFRDTVAAYRNELGEFIRIPFDGEAYQGTVELSRLIPRFPYVPRSGEDRDKRCYEVYNIQVHGLIQRLRATGIKKVVVGVSGGLDSTHALLVAVQAFDRMGRPRKDILAYTMPGFATSKRTLNNAHALMEALGVTHRELDITPSCIQMLKDLEHPYVQGKACYDITFENVQAGERTSHLFRLANFNSALVLGTGDLSELALGWCTYGVGDHMSHYNVNGSVPKTLIQHLIRWVIRKQLFGSEINATLQSILDTEISPELIPGLDNDASPAQSTESVIGPYELQDFNLYYISRYGFRPSKVAYLAYHAWSRKDRGIWPDGIACNLRREYDLAAIKKWLKVFLHRFFATSQFKRSCLPDGPKVGSGGSLSPRGDWRAPSDSGAGLWLKELENGVP